MITEDINAVRDELVNKGLIYFACVISLGVTASSLRAIEHGWHPTYLLHIVLTVIVIVGAILRKHLSYNIRVFILVGPTFIVGLVGLPVFGLVGAGMHALVIAILMTSIAFGTRGGLAISAIVLLAILGIGFAVSRGIITFTFDINQYATSITAWLFVSIILLVFVPVIIIAFGVVQDHLVKSIQSLTGIKEQLLREKELLNVTLRSIGDGIITTDVDAKIVLINKVTEKMTGWSQSEAVGRPIEEVFNIIDEKTGSPANNLINDVLSSGRIIALANNTALIARDGTRYSIEDSGAPIFDKASGIIGAVLVYRDVTEKRRVAEDLLKVKKLESLGILAGGIAHDFNNILAAILGNISLALMTTNPEDENYELLLESEKASLRAKGLTQQLLTFSKGGEPVKKIAAIDEVIKDSAGFVLHGSNVRCEFRFDEALWPVEIDSDQISQVIQNIIINAAQAMPTGGTIFVDCSNYCLESSETTPLCSGNYIKIVIKDQGVGIPEAMLEKIFDPYFTTKQKGSGLGLAVTHSIVSKHNGSIRVDSELGQGTIFTIYLPASSERPVLAQKDVVAPPVAGQGRIMVMDDEKMVRTFVKRALSRSGYEVVPAEDGDEAIRLYQEAQAAETPIDLIIMDLTIPGGMGGKDAVKEIHKIDPAAKVIVSSGYSNDPVMADFAKYGFCAALVKPVQVRELREVVGKVISS